nr:substrate-binding domain-containing protein [uncultured Actinomyces sp.]
MQAAIAQLGYRPNSVARALVTARSGIIGVVTTTSAHVGPSSMLIALEITAREAGFFTSVVPLDRFNVEDMASAFDHFSSLAAEAIIVITPMDSLAEAGVSVPGDVSVAGFDDVPLAAYAGLGLTTVHQDFADCGRCAMEAVSQALEGGSVDTYVRPTRLVVRGSTEACARSGAFSSACVPCARGDLNAHSTDVCRRSGRSVNGRSPEMWGCR